MTKRRRSTGVTREFPRTARVNELLREILGEELDRIEDPRLEWVSISAVDVTAELTSAVVFYSTLQGPESDPEILAALDDHRIRLQKAIGQQARIRNTPLLRFAPDDGVRTGMRISAILAGLDITADDDESVLSATDTSAPQDHDLATGEHDGE